MKMTDPKKLPWSILNQCADFTQGDWPDLVPLGACCLVPLSEATRLAALDERFAIVERAASILFEWMDSDVANSARSFRLHEGIALLRSALGEK